MRKIFNILILLLLSTAFAQNNGQIALNWSLNAKIAYQTFEETVPKFQDEFFYYDSSKKEIFARIKINQTGFVNENSLKISNLVFENIATTDLGELNIVNIPETINASLSNNQDRENVSALINLSPIIKEGNSFKKLLSFSYSFEAGNLNRNANNVSTITNSVLATGNWYRFYVQNSGAFIIDKNFLKKLGINTNDFDPRNFKIYGSGGKMAPLLNSEFYPNDLTENAIFVSGEDDGVFNDNDFAVFYGEGMDNWSEDNKTFGNLYSDKAYYYINIDGNAGKRIQEINQPSASPTTTFTTFDFETFHEVDLINIGKLGRRWYGENFTTNNEQVFDFNIPNATAGSSIKIDVQGASRAFNGTNFKIFAMC